MKHAGGPLFTMRPEDLARVQRFGFDPVPASYGRIEIWEPPQPQRQYVAGADFALGLEGRDYDAAIVLDISATPARQVAEAHVHLGERFDRVLFALLTHYNDAFLVGERQVGLPILRSLLFTYGYGHMYYDRDEASRSRSMGDKLGYWRSTGDVCIPNLRRALAQQQIIVRSSTTIEQLGRLQYAPKTGGIDPREAMDRHMGIRLRGGGSPDLVMALGYAWHAAGEVPKFDNPKRKYAPRSLGDVLGHALIDAPPPEQGWKARRPRR